MFDFIRSHPWAISVLSITLNILNALAYAYSGNRGMAWYWISAASITMSTIFMGGRK